jgi:hypothetical protein
MLNRQCLSFGCFSNLLLANDEAKKAKTKKNQKKTHFISCVTQKNTKEEFSFSLFDPQSLHAI